MALAADVLSGLLTFVFGSAALAKLFRQKQQLATAAKLRIPWKRYRWIGLPEATAAAGLLIGFARASVGAGAAIGLAVLMAGALYFRLRARDKPGFLVGDTALLVLAAATATLRVTMG